MAVIFPAGPNNRPELWTNFANKIALGEVVFIVHGGEVVRGHVGNQSSAHEMERTVESFLASDVVRLGSSGGQAIGPFFAFRLSDGIAELSEYAIDSHIHGRSAAAIQEALPSVSISLYLERKGNAGISLPFALEKWSAKEWRPRSEHDGRKGFGIG